MRVMERKAADTNNWLRSAGLSPAPQPLPLSAPPGLAPPPNTVTLEEGSACSDTCEFVISHTRPQIMTPPGGASWGFTPAFQIPRLCNGDQGVCCADYQEKEITGPGPPQNPMNPTHLPLKQ